MSFDADETSAEQCRPIDLFTFTLPTATYRLTSYYRDVVFGGQTFTALPANRGQQSIPTGSEPRELVVYLPITHALVQRYAKNGIPPGQVLVKVERLQQVSGAAQQIFGGKAASLAVEGSVASLNCPAELDDPFRVRLPVVAAQRSCNHILYDTQCQVARGSFVVNTTVASFSGTTVNVASMGANPTQWAYGGEILHVPTGERRTILAQVGNVITIDVPIIELANSDAVQVFAGCNHTAETCRDKFANIVNYGGHPQLSLGQNNWSLSGKGLY